MIDLEWVIILKKIYNTDSLIEWLNNQINDELIIWIT